MEGGKRERPQNNSPFNNSDETNEEEIDYSNYGKPVKIIFLISYLIFSLSLFISPPLFNR